MSEEFKTELDLSKYYVKHQYILSEGNDYSKACGYVIENKSGTPVERYLVVINPEDAEKYNNLPRFYSLDFPCIIGDLVDMMSCISQVEAINELKNIKDGISEEDMNNIKELDITNISVPPFDEVKVLAYGEVLDLYKTTLEHYKYRQVPTAIDLRSLDYGINLSELDLENLKKISEIRSIVESLDDVSATEIKPIEAEEIFGREKVRLEEGRERIKNILKGLSVAPEVVEVEPTVPTVAPVGKEEPEVEAEAEAEDEDEEESEEEKMELLKDINNLLRNVQSRQDKYSDDVKKQVSELRKQYIEYKMLKEPKDDSVLDNLKKTFNEIRPLVEEQTRELERKEKKELEQLMKSTRTGMQPQQGVPDAPLHLPISVGVSGGSLRRTKSLSEQKRTKKQTNRSKSNTRRTKRLSLNYRNKRGGARGTRSQPKVKKTYEDLNTYKEKYDAVSGKTAHERIINWIKKLGPEETAKLKAESDLVQIDMARQIFSDNNFSKGLDEGAQKKLQNFLGEIRTDNISAGKPDMWEKTPYRGKKPGSRDEINFDTLRKTLCNYNSWLPYKTLAPKTWPIELTEKEIENKESWPERFSKNWISLKINGEEKNNCILKHITDNLYDVRQYDKKEVGKLIFQTENLEITEEMVISELKKCVPNKVYRYEDNPFVKVASFNLHGRPRRCVWRFPSKMACLTSNVCGDMSMDDIQEMRTNISGNFINNLDVDVVCLQEACDPLARAAIFKVSHNDNNYPYRVHAKDTYNNKAIGNNDYLELTTKLKDGSYLQLNEFTPKEYEYYKKKNIITEDNVTCIRGKCDKINIDFKNPGEPIYTKLGTYILGLGKRTIIQPGGIEILSRYPIIKQSSKAYTFPAGADHLVAKGVVYAKIDYGESSKKGIKYLHVFNIHPSPYVRLIYEVAKLSSAFGTSLVRGRKELAYINDYKYIEYVHLHQLQEISKFINETIKADRDDELENYMKNNAVVILGDYNINKFDVWEKPCDMKKIQDNIVNKLMKEKDINTWKEIIKNMSKIILENSWIKLNESDKNFGKFNEVIKEVNRDQNKDKILSNINEPFDKDIINLQRDVDVLDKYNLSLNDDYKPEELRIIDTLNKHLKTFENLKDLRGLKVKMGEQDGYLVVDDNEIKFQSIGGDELEQIVTEPPLRLTSETIGREAEDSISQLYYRYMLFDQKITSGAKEYTGFLRYILGKIGDIYREFEQQLNDNYITKNEKYICGDKSIEPGWFSQDTTDYCTLPHILSRFLHQIMEALMKPAEKFSVYMERDMGRPTDETSGYEEKQTSRNVTSKDKVIKKLLSIIQRPEDIDNLEHFETGLYYDSDNRRLETTNKRLKAIIENFNILIVSLLKLNSGKADDLKRISKEVNDKCDKYRNIIEIYRMECSKYAFSEEFYRTMGMLGAQTPPQKLNSVYWNYFKRHIDESDNIVRPEWDISRRIEVPSELQDAMKDYQSQNSYKPIFEGKHKLWYPNIIKETKRLTDAVQSGGGKKPAYQDDPHQGLNIDAKPWEYTNYEVSITPNIVPGYKGYFTWEGPRKGSDSDYLGNSLVAGPFWPVDIYETIDHVLYKKKVFSEGERGLDINLAVPDYCDMSIIRPYMISRLGIRILNKANIEDCGNYPELAPVWWDASDHYPIIGTFLFNNDSRRENIKRDLNNFFKIHPSYNLDTDIENYSEIKSREGKYDSLKSYKVNNRERGLLGFDFSRHIIVDEFKMIEDKLKAELDEQRRLEDKDTVSPIGPPSVAQLPPSLTRPYHQAIIDKVKNNMFFKIAEGGNASYIRYLDTLIRNTLPNNYGNTFNTDTPNNTNIGNIFGESNREFPIFPLESTEGNSNPEPNLKPVGFRFTPGMYNQTGLYQTALRGLQNVGSKKKPRNNSKGGCKITKKRNIKYRR